MKIKEITRELPYINPQKLRNEIANLVLQYEPKLTSETILHDIDLRNKQGEGLMSPNILSLHVQNGLVEDDVVFYINLNKDFEYFSKQLNQKFYINKLVLIVVNPNHQLDHLSNLEKFIAE